MVKSLPAGAEDTGSIPDQGRSHMLQSKWTCVLQLLNLYSRARKQLSPRATTTRTFAPKQEKPLQWEACAPHLESSACSLQLEKSPCSNKDPTQPKIINDETKNYVKTYIKLHSLFFWYIILRIDLLACLCFKTLHRPFFFKSLLSLLQYCFYFMFLVFLAARHVKSWLPGQGSNPHPLHWKVKS